MVLANLPDWWIDKPTGKHNRYVLKDYRFVMDPVNPTHSCIPYVPLYHAILEMKKHYFAILVYLLCLTTGAFKRNPGKTTMTTSIHFKNWVGTIPLVLFDETYTNGFGEPFVISKFRYYISNISFIDASNKETMHTQ